MTASLPRVEKLVASRDAIDVAREDVEWMTAEVDQCKRAVAALRVSRRMDRSLEMWVASTLRDTVRPRFVAVAETHHDALTVDDHREAIERIDHIVAGVLAGGRIEAEQEHFVKLCLNDEALPAFDAELRGALLTLDPLHFGRDDA